MVSNKAQDFKQLLRLKEMNGSSDSFIKVQKKNRQFDDGINKQKNTKKFKSSKKHFKQTDPITTYKFQ